MDTPSISRAVLEAAMRVLGFCMMPKDERLVRSCNLIVVFTGDGWKLCDFAVAKLNCTPPNTQVFVTGADNLMAKEREGLVRASDFRKKIITCYPTRENFVDCDDTAQYTPGQAQSLLRYLKACKQNKRGEFQRIALICSGHHIVRAWLTTLAQMDKEKVDDLVVVPVPGYDISFATPDSDLTNPLWSQWGMWDIESIRRILEYQGKEVPDVARFDRALAYIRNIEPKLVN